MNEIEQLITSERAKGTPDSKIYDMVSLRTANSTQQVTKPAERSFGGEVIPTLGAIGGGVVGAVVGGPPGAVIGSGLGGAAGETIQQAIEKDTGQREKFDVAQIGATGVTSAVTQGVFSVAGKVAGVTLKAARSKLISLLKWGSGYADDVISKAMQRTPGAVETVKGGESALNEIIKRTTEKFHTFAGKQLQAAKEEISSLSKTLSLGGPGKTVGRNLLFQEGKDFIKQVTNSLRKNHNIGVQKEGPLLFGRINQPSRIVGGSERSAIQEAFNALKTIRGNTSIKHIDSILEKLIVLKRKTPAGSPTGPEAKAIINEMLDSVKGFIKTSYPTYADVLEKNIAKRIFINDAKELFGDSAKPSPKELSLIAKKILQLFNTGNLAVRESVESIGKEVGEDVVGGAAGALVRTGDQMSVRASNLTKRGVIEKAVEFVPRKAIQLYIKTGNISGDLLSNPMLIKIAKGVGMTIKALVQEVANVLENKTTR